MMRTVAVLVEHNPGPRGLLGLYEGVPLTSRTSSYAGVLPDRITIFRHAICAICLTEAEVADQVRKTVVHEVGHHFGISDERLEELGWSSRSRSEQHTSELQSPDHLVCRLLLQKKTLST